MCKSGIRPLFRHSYEARNGFSRFISQQKPKRPNIQQKKITAAFSLRVSTCSHDTVQAICECCGVGGAGVGGGFCEQNKFYLPWSRDAPDFFFFSEMWHRKGGRGQNQIVAYGCLLLLLSWIHSQCRHCVRRIGIRGATMRQSGISEHECLMSPLLLLKSGQCRLQSEWLMRWY